MSTAFETGSYVGGLTITIPGDNGANGKRSNGAAEIRKFKEIVKDSFPSVTAAVTASHTELNILDGVTASTAEINTLAGATGVIETRLDDLETAADLIAPAGTKMVFAQASPPTGWTIDNSFDGRALFTPGTYNSVAKSGGGTGGSHDPGLMDKVPSHTHGTSSLSGTAASAGAHTHTVSASENTGGADVTLGSGPGTINTSSAGAHTHTVSISGSTDANGSAANWTPKYACVCVGTKD